MQVKSASSAASKWVSRAQGAGQAYTDGVNNPKNPWAATTASSDKNWAAGVQSAVSDGRFAKGVNAAGDAAWKAGAVNKGAARYPQGVSQAQTKYSSGVQPYLDKLSSLQLPPRMPKGDPANFQRSAAVGTALRALKLGK